MQLDAVIGELLNGLPSPSLIQTLLLLVNVHLGRNLKAKNATVKIKFLLVRVHLPGKFRKVFM